MDHLERREQRQIRPREDYMRDEIRLGDFWYDLKNNPYFSLSAGFGIGMPASWISILVVTQTGYFDPIWLLLSTIPMLPSAALTWRGLRQFRRWGKRGQHSAARSNCSLR